MESVLLYALGVGIFFFAILVSISLHELGHFYFAKKFGVKVTEYFVGFGKTVWSTKRGETEYGIKAIPLGGFVKIVGMMPAEESGKTPRTPFGRMVAQARANERENLDPADEARYFYKLPPGKKLIVMGAGATINVLIAFVLFTLMFSTYGNRTYDVPKDKLVVVSLPKCVIDLNDPRSDTEGCRPSDPMAPALRDGMKLEDRIVAFNGTKVSDWQDLRKLIQANGSRAATVEVVRGSKTVTIETETISAKRPTVADARVIEEVGYLGVAPRYEEIITKGGPLYTAEWMGDQAVVILKSFKHLPAKLTNVAYAIIGQEERDPDSPVSIVGGSRFAGEITSLDSEQYPDVTVADKAAFVVSIVAAFNLFIGLFNFFPILPLDGGHMFGAAWEGIKRRIARLRGRPDPAPFDVARLIPLAYGMGLFLFGVGALLIIGDLVAPVRMGG